MKLDELKRLDAAATPAPWIYDHGDILDADLSGLLRDVECDTRNTRLIAAARNALPALLAVAEAAKAYRLANEDAGAWNDMRQAESVRASELGEALSAALAELEAQP